MDFINLLVPLAVCLSWRFTAYIVDGPLPEDLDVEPPVPPPKAVARYRPISPT